MSGGLRGVRIVNTRAAGQAAELDAFIAARGGVPIPYPCIAIAPPEDLGPLRAALARFAAGEFDWLAFTSANAVHAVAATLEGWSLPATTQVAVVGDVTAAAVQAELGLAPDVVAPERTGASLAESLPVAAGESLLLPGSNIARAELPAALRSRGVTVEIVEAYRTIVGAGGDHVPAMLARGEIAAVAFASPSAVEGFGARFQREAGILPDLTGIAVACIGGATLQAARNQGYAHAVAANDHTVPSMLDALAHALMRPAHGGTPWQ